MKFDVFGFGNALVDILIKVDESHVMELDLNKGLFHLVEEEKSGKILERFSDFDQKTVPAGSAANTIFAISSIGGNAVLCGKVGKDAHGDMYEEVVVKDEIKSQWDFIFIYKRRPWLAISKRCCTCKIIISVGAGSKIVILCIYY